MMPTTTPMRILIAHDGSAGADEALADLHHAGFPHVAEVLVVSIAEEWLPHSRRIANAPPDAHPGLAAARATAVQAGQCLVGAFPDWRVRTKALAGSPAGRILESAREWDAGLIAVGSLGRSPMDRLLLGSVAGKVANEAHCSVRICRYRELQPGERMNIMIGFDGAAGSWNAVRAVAGRRWPAHTQVALVTCDGFGVSPVTGMGTPAEEDFARELQAPAARLLRDAGLDVSPAVLEGDPKSKLAEYAAAYRVSAIFIGDSENSALHRALMGTVASAIIRRVMCSVEVVRTPADAVPAPSEVA